MWCNQNFVIVNPYSASVVESFLFLQKLSFSLFFGEIFSKLQTTQQTDQDNRKEKDRFMIINIDNLPQ